MRPVAIGRVLMPKVVNRSALAADLPTDPVVMETAWRSNNHKYINLGLQLKTGTTDGNVAAQAIGWVYTGSTTLDGGRNAIPSCWHTRRTECRNTIPHHCMLVCRSTNCR